MTADRGLFYEYIKMATDVDMQFFSHLNGLTLGNNWGDLIRLLDKALVTGIDLTQITSASIDAQGDITLSLYAAHNCMLFQIIELSGFADVSVDGALQQINEKYRIKGIPANNQLILKGIVRTVDNPPLVNISSLGSAKLASLGYEIIFRDTNDVKRVYRAKNPAAQHPYIRVDESLTSPDGTTGVYTSTYAKYAMVGLLERMDHIDDYSNPEVLQLPFDPSNPEKNWKITGAGPSVVRGWSRWYWASNRSDAHTKDTSVSDGNRPFTIIGDQNFFYHIGPHQISNIRAAVIQGCGVINHNLSPWALLSTITTNNADANFSVEEVLGGTPLVRSDIVTSNQNPFFIIAERNSALMERGAYYQSVPIIPNYASGSSGLYSNSDVSALEIPVAANKRLQGTLPHLCWMGGAASNTVIILLSEASMYLTIPLNRRGLNSGQWGGIYCYLGELE